jgi:hypothetical protein
MDPHESTPLKWSAQLNVTPPLRTPRLPGDKILLPQSALEQLLAAAPLVEVSDQPGLRQLTSSFDPFNPHTFAAETYTRAVNSSRQAELPHPLTFRIVNPTNGRIVYAGIREFSSQEGEASLSSFLRESLGIEKSSFTREHNDGNEFPAAVRIHASQLPKGTYVRLRPLEAGYDSEDWKSLLERHLRENFTTLTTGMLLNVTSGGQHGDYRFLVDKVAPEGDGICIVDTDLEVDIEPLNEEQARETLKRRVEKSSRVPGSGDGSSVGGLIMVGQEISGQVRLGEYVDYQLQDWDRQDRISIELEAADGGDIDLLVSPLSAHQRNRPRIDEYIFGDLSTPLPKRLRLQPSNIELAGAEALYISVHSFVLTGLDNTCSKSALPFTLRVTRMSSLQTPDVDRDVAHHDPEEAECKNCRQWVPQQSLFLHENFCFRNNVFCPECSNVFQKKSAEWQNHWHCPHDEAHGNDLTSKMKHDQVSHIPHICPQCQLEASSLPALARHRTTICPYKPILCQFCHLIVPQQGESDPDINDPEVLISGLTPHELVDGGRTTECHMCNKIVRLRDMNTHLRHHDLQRLSRPLPLICKNVNCGRTLESSRNSSIAAKTPNGSLGLCGICFGPLYSDTHDPDGAALRRRVERRYLHQMLTSCGKPWCRNTMCKTGRKHSLENTSSTTSPTPTTTKDMLSVIKPVLDAVAVAPTVQNTAPFYFCTDEVTQQRRQLAEMLAAEDTYCLEWCIAAVEGTTGDLDRARDWLRTRAPAKDEVMKT